MKLAINVSPNQDKNVMQDVNDLFLFVYESVRVARHLSAVEDAGTFQQ